MSWYWRKIEDQESAKDATKAAVGVSYFVASVTGLLAILSIGYRHPVMGLNGWSLTDAILFTIVGWRISRLSRAWAIAGLAVYVLEVGVSIGERGVGVGILAVVFIIIYVNAVRGAFLYHKYVKNAERGLLPAPGQTTLSPPSEQ